MNTRYAVALSALLPLTGCTYVTSGAPPTPNVTGEAWYTKNTGFGLLVWSSSIWYCPPAEGGPATCTEARIVGPGQVAPAPLAPAAEPAAPAKKKKKKKPVEEEEAEAEVEEEGTEPSE